MAPVSQDRQEYSDPGTGLGVTAQSERPATEGRAPGTGIQGRILFTARQGPVSNQRTKSKEAIAR